MDILALLATAAFLAGAIVAVIQKSWVLMLICIGLFLLALTQTGLIAA